MVWFSLPRRVSRVFVSGGMAAVSLGFALLTAPTVSRAENVMDRMTRLARAGETHCADPWTYSRGLDKCICIKAGYSKQWGQCLPMEPGLADKTGAGAAGLTSALPAPSTTGALPKEKSGQGGGATQSDVASKPRVKTPMAVDPASRMEQIARAQDCLSSLGLYDGAIDGEGNEAATKAYGRFAAARGLPHGDDLVSVRAQTALQGACGQRWVSAKAE
ncbi:hypothetical protein A7A08_02082 [Methyloligella halotolerans]|uniref:Peptidoglycan binding domain protein n=1 Tax=Methyloligella halotolerans TaxID=1177755 RepID=A0A1E2RXD7_9HYPH|nr:hypothetical protein [Methyloligella halotolerans]ODA66785.1 hypothetical protein A7A08_02082 [Methyloligella halotolerans]